MKFIIKLSISNDIENKDLKKKTCSFYKFVKIRVKPLNFWSIDPDDNIIIR